MQSIRHFPRPMAIAGSLLLVMAAGSAQAANPVAGAIVGAGAGALIGQAFGGQDGAFIGGAIGAIAGVGIAQSTRGPGPMQVPAVGPAPLRVHYRGPDYAVGPYPPPPRHRNGYWQRYQDQWGAPYWVWNDFAPVVVAPPVYGPPVYAPPVYIRPGRGTPRHFEHPQRHFEGAALPYRPDPRFDPGGWRQRR